MREALAAIVFALAGGVSDDASAQQEARAQAAFNLFAHVCVSLQADQTAVSELLESDGWVQSTSDALPRSSRRSHVRVSNSSSADVFEYPDDPVWLYVELGDRSASCSVFAVGVSASDVAAVLYPSDTDGRRRASFVATPISFGTIQGHAYTVLTSDISPSSRHRPQREFLHLMLAASRDQ